jgi:hypothetical protein
MALGVRVRLRGFNSLKTALGFGSCFKVSIHMQLLVDSFKVYFITRLQKSLKSLDQGGLMIL